MTSSAKPARRPKIVIRETDAGHLTRLAAQMAHSAPEVADLLLEEIERASIKPDGKVADTVVGMRSIVEFVDEARGASRTVELVHPAEADIAAGRVSIATPIGVGLIGLSPGQTIAWPDRDGRERTLRVLQVRKSGPQPHP